MNEQNNSSQALQVFNNPEFGAIRTAGTSDEPLFCLADVCRILDLQPSRVKQRLNEGGVTSSKVGVQTGLKLDGTPAIQQVEMIFIDEPNLYKVIMRSDKPQAEAFQDWVCGEVLPTIRKTGGYTIPKTYADALALAAEQAKAIEMQAAQLNEAKQHIAIAEEVIEQNERQLAEQAPKVLFADSVSASKDAVLIAELAKILTQKGMKIGQNRLFRLMRENGFLCSHGSYYNQPTQRATEMGLFQLQKGSVSDPYGTTHSFTTPKVTGKGLQYFVNFFLAKTQTA